jgi:hypothetical protein
MAALACLEGGKRANYSPFDVDLQWTWAPPTAPNPNYTEQQPRQSLFDAGMRVG